MIHNQKELIDSNFFRLKTLEQAFNTEQTIKSMLLIYHDNPVLVPVWLTCCFELGIIERTGTHMKYKYTLAKNKININTAKEVHLLYYSKQKKIRDDRKIKR